MQTLDQVDRLVRSAKRLSEKAKLSANSDEWTSVVSTYEDALALMPKDMTLESRKLLLEKCKAQMMAKQLPEAHGNLDDMLKEPAKKQDQDLINETRSSLANSQYYMTWLMRLEGEPEDRWMPEIESARQHYKLLSDQVEKSGDSGKAKKYKEDLESSIRLARMDLSELQGLPLPSQ